MKTPASTHLLCTLTLITGLLTMNSASSASDNWPERQLSGPAVPMTSAEPNSGSIIYDHPDVPAVITALNEQSSRAGRATLRYPAPAAENDGTKGNSGLDDVDSDDDDC